MGTTAAATSFLGRERELAVAQALLAETRLLTVTGPGGAGKTRLALELQRRTGGKGAGSEIAASFLAPLRDPGLVLPSVARSLGVRERPGQTALEAIRSHLDERSALVLVDNLEHLRPAWPDLGALRDGCPGLTLLVTSREPLRLAGERVYELPPLAEDEGVALFCERAHVAPSETIAELSARLEGLPLAIELAAARLRLLTPEQLLERLSRRLDVLKGDRDADPRQQTLRATIAWSYDLLQPEEQALFRRLAVFAGGCTLEAAQEIAGADAGSVRSLVDKNLLRLADDRYSMLETIRELAAELLSGEEAEGAHARHTVFYGDLAEAAQDELGGPAQREWMERLATELPNYRVILERLHGAGDRVLLARLGSDLWRIWHRRGYLDEARYWLERALEDPEALPDEIRMRAEGACGYVAMDQGDLGAARGRLETCVAIARRMGDAWHVANALNNLGLLANQAGEPARAEELHLESLALRREFGDRGRIAASLNNLGVVALDRGALDRAHGYFDECLELFREVGDTRGVAVSLGNLGEVAYRQGDLRRAATRNHESVRVFVDLDEPPGVLYCIHALARVAAVEGSLERAARLAGATASLAERTGNAPPRDDGVLARARDALGEEAWHAAFATGAALTFDEAVAVALEETADA